MSSLSNLEIGQPEDFESIFRPSEDLSSIHREAVALLGQADKELGRKDHMRDLDKVQKIVRKANQQVILIIKVAQIASDGTSIASGSQNTS